MSIFVELDELIWQIFIFKLRQCHMGNVLIFIWIAIGIWILGIYNAEFHEVFQQGVVGLWTVYTLFYVFSMIAPIEFI